MSVETYFQQCRTQIDAALDRALPTPEQHFGQLHEAMRYSVLGDGKRIRPALTLATAEAFSVPVEQVLAPACAVELIHAYSLIHDDLPAMDDDDLRRGRPTCHIAFDEATAILAGDALQALAFELLATAPALSADIRLRMIQALSSASGHSGMVGGQAIDLASVGAQPRIEDIERMHRCKTGALIECAVNLGALTAADEAAPWMDGLRHYAQSIGLAFQVQDDILDVEGQTETLGKQQGADIARNKPTYPTLLGMEGAKQLLQRLHQQACDSVSSLGSRGERLRAIADFVVQRHR